MLPKQHFIIGILFAIILKIVCPWVTLLNLTLIIAANVLIDFDHYMCAVMKFKSWSLKDAYKYHDNVVTFENEVPYRIRGDFHVFHTVEIHLIILVLSFIYAPFWFIFMGMFLHSTTDYVDLMLRDRLYRREYFLVRWLSKKV